jgi:hypothetical protein
MQPPGPDDPDETQRLDGGPGSYPPGQPGPGYPPGQASPGYPPGQPPPPGAAAPGPYPPPAAGAQPGFADSPYPPGGYPQAGYGEGYQQPPYPGGYPTGGYPTWPPPANRNQRWNLLIAVAGVVVVVLAATVGITLAVTGDDKPVAGPPRVSPSVLSPTATTPLPTPTPSPTGSPGQFTARQRTLVSLLDPRSMTDCRPNPDSEDSYTDAAVACTAEDGRQVLAFHEVDASALNHDRRQVESHVSGTGGDCRNGQDEVFDWNVGNGPRVGTAICYHEKNGQFTIVWTYDGQLVAFLAQDSDPTALYQWWQRFDPLPAQPGSTGTAPPSGSRPA